MIRPEALEANLLVVQAELFDVKLARAVRDS